MRYISATIIAFLITFVTACGKLAPEIKGNTKSDVNVNVHVSGEVKATSEFVFKIDVSGCNKLYGAAQATCITEAVKALGDIANTIKQFACKDDICKQPTGGAQ